MPVTDQPPQGTPRSEWELILSCARAHLGQSTAGRIKDLLNARLNWDVLVRLAMRHRVMPVLHAQMEHLADDVPRDLWRMLHDLFFQNAARNLAMAEELVRLAQRFAAEGLPLMCFRGPVMAFQLYGNFALRQFADLDLLVRPADAIRATRLLESLGYEAQFHLNARQEQALVALRTERFFIRPAERLCADLHWRVLPSCFGFERDEGEIWRRASTTSLEEVRLMTLADEDLFLFLCAHGAKHAWGSLGHVCDVAEWMRRHPGSDWGAILRRAGKEGKKRMVLLALALAKDVLGAVVPGDVAKEAASDKAVTELAARAAAGWVREGAQRPKSEEWSYTMRTLERIRDKAGYAAYLAAVPSGIELGMVELPPPLFGLYYPLRAGRLLIKRAAGLLNKGRRSSG